MLIQLGDVWIDPEQVEAVFAGHEVMGALVEEDTTCTLATDADTYAAHGITAEEAVRRINRCLESRMGAK